MRSRGREEDPRREDSKTRQDGRRGEDGKAVRGDLLSLMRGKEKTQGYEKLKVKKNITARGGMKIVGIITRGEKGSITGKAEKGNIGMMTQDMRRREAMRACRTKVGNM